MSTFKSLTELPTHKAIAFNESQHIDQDCIKELLEYNEFMLALENLLLELENEEGDA